MHALARIHCALALLLLLAVGSSVSARSATPCCLSYDTVEIPLSDVVNYQITSSVCALPAVIFLTLKRGIICADSSEEWVKNYVNELKLRNIG